MKMIKTWTGKLNSQRLKTIRQVRFYRNFIKPSSNCFDIGAHIGVKTNVFLKIGANVVAVEPQTACIDTLNKKFKGNPKLKVVKKAVGRTEYSDRMMISNESQISTFSQEFVDAYSYQPQFNWDRSEEVNFTSLDLLIKEFGRPDFCKIDVEGFEAEVFKGLTQTIPMISFEFNRPLRHLVYQSIEMLEKLCTGIYNYVAYENAHFELDHWVRADNMLNLIRTLDQNILTGDIYVKFDQD